MPAHFFFYSASLQWTLAQDAQGEFHAQFTSQRPEASLLWNPIEPDGFRWTDFTIRAIESYGTSLANGARDVKAFCPNYDHLSNERKVNFWAHLVSAIVKNETDFNPLARYREKTMGVDAITRQGGL